MSMKPPLLLSLVMILHQSPPPFILTLAKTADRYERQIFSDIVPVEHLICQVYAGKSSSLYMPKMRKMFRNKITHLVFL